MRKQYLVGLAAGLLMFGMVGMANATTLTSTISMDNGYEVFLSTSDMTQGTSFGAANNWVQTYQNTTMLSAGNDYYLHVYGYDQGGIAGFLGQFSLSGNDHTFSNGDTTLLTGMNGWKGNNTGWGNAYSPVTDLGANGVWPWGTISGISSSAHWIWAGDATTNDYAYFSTKISATSQPTPIPGAVWLMGSGLAGMFGLRRRKQEA
ncbi:MAG: VPLPA-CTERM sorting domain-containing protein [Desulfobulbaceae bacterium]|nr:VPLPA-CTERM sorting domain-containing protein [Desulfobulbaceae bacterium]HIJ91543.1 hypothetical protein [Deltaproteobacteria bacterium]